MIAQKSFGKKNNFCHCSRKQHDLTNIPLRTGRIKINFIEWILIENWRFFPEVIYSKSRRERKRHNLNWSYFRGYCIFTVSSIVGLIIFLKIKWSFEYIERYNTVTRSLELHCSMPVHIYEYRKDQIKFHYDGFYLHWLSTICDHNEKLEV